MMPVMFALSWVFVQPSPRVVPLPVNDYAREVLASRINSGPYAGGYKLNQMAAGADFYFSSVGLRAFATDPRFKVGAYLSLYLSKADEYGLVQRPGNLGQIPINPDADDSEASTFLILAADYFQCSSGKAWWKENVKQVKFVADKVLVANQLSVGAGTGLISTFSKYRKADNPAVLAGQDTGYLMDECENYGGLSSLASVLSKMGDSAATKYASSAALLANAIAQFYNPKGGFFFWAATNIHKKPSYSSGPAIFYPNRLAQIFPELYAVPLGSKTQTASEYAKGWNYLNAGGPTWAEGFPDSSVDGFPMMQVGYVASLRGIKDLATMQKAWFDRIYLTNNYKFWGIDQIGFRLRF
jgi:hypothetical protein